MELAHVVGLLARKERALDVKPLELERVEGCWVESDVL